MILLKAKEHNWGLISPGSWDKRSWKVYHDGWFQYKVTYRSMGEAELPEIPDVTEEGSLSAGQLQRMEELLNSVWSEEKTEEAEGSAWEFKMYRDEKLIKHRDVGYIRGIEPFESVVKILRDAVEK